MGSGDETEEQQAHKLTQFALDLLLRHVESKKACKAWGDVSLALSFERGYLRQVETIDKTKVRASMLAAYPVAQQSATRQK